MKSYKKHLLTGILIVAIIVLGVVFIKQHRDKVVSDAQAALGITGTLTFKNTSRPSSTSQFGYNGLFIEGLIKNNDINDDVMAIDSVMTATDAAWIRFPGGTRSNGYIFDLTAPGLGDDSASSKSYKNNFIVDYANVAGALGAKTAYVMNLAAHYPYYYKGPSFMPPRIRNKTDAQIIKMNIDAVEYLIDQGVSVPVIELGNELFAADLSQLRNVSVMNKPMAEVERIMKPEMDKYVSLVAQYKNALDDLAVRKSAALGRKISFQIGVPIMLPHNGDMSKPEFVGPFGNRNTYWNQRVSGVDADAFIIHTYSNLTSCKSIAAADAYLECLKTKNAEDIVLLGKALDRVNATYPNKKIWITEFNSGFGFQPDNRVINSGFVGSAEHVKYLRDVVTVFKNKGVDLYTVHMLYSAQEKQYAIINNLTSTGARKINTESLLQAQPSICGLIPKNTPAFSTYNCQ